MLVGLFSTSGMNFAQTAKLQPFGIDAAGALKRASIDLDNSQLIHDILQSTSDTLTRDLMAYSAVYLAQQGDASLIPTIKRRFYSDIQPSTSFADRYFAMPYAYLYALYLLNAPETTSLAQEYVDTLVARESRGDDADFELGLSRALRLLGSLNDYSRFTAFETLMVKQVSNNHSIDFPLLVAFADRSDLRVSVFEHLSDFAGSSDEDRRFNAVYYLARDFRDRDETHSILRRIGGSESSKKVWSEAVWSLVEYYTDPYALTVCEKVAKAATDTGSFARALVFIEFVPSPLSLRTLQNIEQSLPPGYYRDFVSSDLADFRPSTIYSQSLSVMSLVDSLKSYTQQVAALGWLADTNFLTELDGHLDAARQAVGRSDSSGCARAVKTFQGRIDIIYKDPLSAGAYKVTIEGWKFLYYNAQYILDRLPQIPPSPILASLTPSSTIAGSPGFSLSVKGKSFVRTSVVVWNGVSRSTSFVADSILQATISVSDVATARTVNVAVVNPGNDTSNVVPFTITQPPPGLNVKLVNSSGTNLTGGSLQYYDGNWKDATNNNDGTFSVTTNLKTLSLRMTYEFATQTKSSVTVGYDTVAFQTVKAQVKLQDSQGALIDTGTVQYYSTAWKPLGTTSAGSASKELLPGTYTFRMSYASATIDKQQDISANPVIVFQTVSTAVQLKNSQGAFIDTGSVQYYFSSWKVLGTTSNGVATKELLPGNYTFRMSYASATNDKQQNIGTNPTVVFQTVNTAVQLKNSLGAFIDQGMVQYYFSAWKTFGLTTNGVATMELLPGNYTFRMSYASATNDKQQNIGTNSTVVFQTVSAAVQLKNSQSTLMDQGTVQYYFSSWNNLGSTTNGVATKELLPGSYTFRMTYASATNDKQQNIGTNPIVVFQTVSAAVQLQNSQGTLMDQGSVQYYFSSWKDLGATTNGVATKELLPGNYTFRMTYEFATSDKQQNVGTNPTVVFQTVNASVQLKNSQGNPIDTGRVQYYFSAWRDLGLTTNGVAAKELLPASYTFRMTYESVSNDKVQNISTNGTVSFSTVLCTVSVKNAQSQPVNNASISYYSGAWRQIGSTLNGQITKELLPSNLTFRMVMGAASQDKAQNIGTNALVEFVAQ
jgi:hypothetical protein